MAFQEVQKKYGIRFKKGLGQNLLLDDNINRIMVDAASLTPQDDVIEIGAGLGALTTWACRDAGRLLAVEIDRAFMPCLEDRFAGVDNVQLFRGDILNHSMAKLIKEFLPGGTSYKILSNLPYYITTPILFHLWESEVFFDRTVVMVQEEVGMRMAAPVGAPNYGALALAARYYSEVDIIHKVPSSCFRPRPKVDSCIVRLRNRKEPLYPGLDGEFLRSVVRAAFSQRRKTLRNSLAKSATLGVPGDVVLEALAAAGLDPGRRPQTLELDEFALLAREICDRMP